LGLGYFRERGFREDIIRKFQLGFSLDQKDHFSMTALSKGYNKDYLLKSGLSLENEQGGLRDRYRARVMFPVHTLSGKIVAFEGVSSRKTIKRPNTSIRPNQRFTTRATNFTAFYFAKQPLPNMTNVTWWKAIPTCCPCTRRHRKRGRLQRHGPHPWQIRLIHRFTTNVTVLYDGDAAGIRASLKGINLLLEEGLNIKVLLLPDGEDPDSFARQHSASSFTEYLKANETDFIRFKTDILLKEAGDDPAARARLIQDIVESIALIADDITRTVYTAECSRQLSIREEVLQKEVDKRRIQHLRQQPSGRE
jgi:DNA primase